MVSCRSHDCVAYAIDNGGCTNFDCDWAIVQEATGSGKSMLTVGMVEIAEVTAYIANAQFHLDSLRQTVYDGLTGVNDECLRDSLLEDVTAIDINLRKALL